MVYTGGPCFGEGQIKYCSKLVWVLFWNKADRWNLEILKLGEGKGPLVRPFATSSAKFEVTTSGLREALGKFLEKRTA